MNGLAGNAEPAGRRGGAAEPVAGKGDGPAAPLPDAVIALIGRERYRFDAVGAPVARPVADIRNRLLIFYKVNVTVEQIMGALGWPDIGGAR